MPVTARTLSDRNGRRIEPGQLLGRGGEGVVHEVLGEPSLVAKIYHQQLTPERAAKIEAMAKMASSELDQFCAWPRGLLLEGGQARGLLMQRIVSHKELHVLHGPKSRKAAFPEAGFDFLVHVALNVARAFARLHTEGVIVGDVNDRGIMVGNNGTVRLIDCDSFQISTPQHSFHCEVGVPEYTPPELQGQALSGLLRTESHDVFGLAVLIFRLLFMGRHPFAGTFHGGGGHKEIHEAIREFRYAYARDASRTRMTPPPSMLAVSNGAGPNITELFERVFSPEAVRSSNTPTQRVAADQSNRPTARDWVAALESLRDNLAACRFNAAHAYTRSCSSCPWCELEQRYNVELFNFIPAEGADAQLIDVEAVWKALGELKAPDIPKPIPESFLRLRPEAGPPELLKLRDEAAGLVAEAHRARDAAAQFQTDAQQQHLDAETFLTMAALENESSLHWANWLQRLRAPQPRLPGNAVLNALGLTMLVLASVYRSIQFLFLGAVCFAAIYGIDALISYVRQLMLSRIKRRLDAARRSVIAADTELNAHFEAVYLSAVSLTAEAQRTADLARILETASAAAQSRYAYDSSAEIETRDRLVKSAEKSADVARKALSAYSTEAKALLAAIDERRERLALSRTILTSLTLQREADYKKLRDQDRQTQLHRFLDTHYINKADIKSVTHALKSALASFGIETAADISEPAISKVPGFGKVRTQRLLDWRNHITKKFRYTPAQAIDPAQTNAIESKYAAGHLRIARDFTTAQTEIERRIAELAARIGAAKQTADSSVRALAQAHANRKALDL